MPFRGYEGPGSGAGQREDDAMVAVTVYGGAGQIGGNKILSEDRHTGSFLDFAEPVAQASTLPPLRLQAGSPL